VWAARAHAIEDMEIARNKYSGDADPREESTNESSDENESQRESTA